MKGFRVPLTEENKWFINAVFKGESIASFSKKKLLLNLKFQLQTCSKEWEADLQDTIKKIEQLTDDEFSCLVLMLPFRTMTDVDDEQDEEEYTE